MSSTADEDLNAYNAAVRLLARRDHSTAELRSKLIQKQHPEASVSSALLELTEQNALNDARFAERFAEQQLDKGRGPLAIKARLEQRGIESELVAEALDSLAVDWVEQAYAVLVQRLHADIITDTSPRSRARIARFLNSRGYASSDALQAYQRACKALRQPSDTD